MTRLSRRWRFWRAELLYDDHPYRNSPSGTIESVGRLTAADLKAHHARMLEGGRLMVVAVGQCRSRRGEEEGRDRPLATVPKGSFRNEPVPALSHAAAPEFQLVDKPVATNYIRGTLAAPSLSHPDYPAFSVTVNILQQILFQEVRVKRNLSYGAEVTLQSNAANSAFISVTTPKPNETLRVIFDQIDFMQRQVLLAEPLEIDHRQLSDPVLYETGDERRAGGAAGRV
jgi:predicted Zn-dependent peptidase